MLDDLLSLLDEVGDVATVAHIPGALAIVPPKALERATALYVWKRAWESNAHASRNGGDRKSARYRAENQNEKISFCSIAAEATGLGERSIQLDVALAEALGADAIRALWAGPIHDNAAALKSVAALAPTGRDALFGVWRDQPNLSFKSAMSAARLRAEQDTEEAAFTRLLDGWTRASSRARRRFLDEIGCDAESAEKLIVSWRKRGSQ